MRKLLVEVLLDLVLALVCTAAITLLFTVMGALVGSYVDWSSTFWIVFMVIYAGLMIVKFDLLG